MKKTHFHLNSFAHSEYSQSEYGNYTNPGKNDYNNINIDDCYYRETQYRPGRRDVNCARNEKLGFV